MTTVDALFEPPELDALPPKGPLVEVDPLLPPAFEGPLVLLLDPPLGVTEVVVPDALVAPP